MRATTLLAIALLAASCAAPPAPVIVPTPQGRLHVYDSGPGAGIPIVFIHGNGANLTQWGAQLAHFILGNLLATFELVAVLLALQLQLVAQRLDCRLELPRFVVSRGDCGLDGLVALGWQQLELFAQ